MPSRRDVTWQEMERDYAQFVGFTYVYAIRAAEVKRWKFGMSADVSRRLEELRSASPVRLSLYGMLCVPDAVAMERAIHTVLKPWNAKGEWFEESDAVLAVAKCLHRQDKVGLAYVLTELARKRMAA